MQGSEVGVLTLMLNGRCNLGQTIMALVAGKQAAFPRTMGHARAFIAPGGKGVVSKIQALERVGVVVVNYPAKSGAEMSKLLGTEKNSQGSYRNGLEENL